MTITEPTTEPTAEPTAAATAQANAACTLEIGGMTCASCVGRVEKALRKLDGGAGAEGELATEVAPVHFAPQQVGLEELTAAVVRAGYSATPRREARPAAEPAQPGTDGAGGARERDAHLTALKRKWQVTLAVGLGL